MTGCRNHDAGCASCHDSGLVPDPRPWAVTEDGAELIPCPRCVAGEERAQAETDDSIRRRAS